MRLLDDAELLSDYVTRRSEEAFATLVERHLSLVYSCALRQVEDPHLAQDVTQAVFIILAQKAGELRRETVLAGWLCRTAHYAACNALKAERRRQFREQEAFMNSLSKESESEVWAQIMPLLDEAVAQLDKADREAVVLRFYQQMPLEEVGRTLGLNADTAQKRVSRALQKLNKYFVKRGVTISVAAIAAAVAANSVQAAPVGLAVTVTEAAAHGAAAGSSTLTIIKGVLKFMAWTKAKIAVTAGVGVLLAAGTTTIAIQQIDEHRIHAWQKSFDFSMVDKVPPQVTIYHAPASRSPSVHGWSMWNGKALGLGLDFKEMMEAINFSDPQRLIVTGPVPEGKFDFIANLPKGSFWALKNEVEGKFGLTVRRTCIETNAMILTVRATNAPGLKIGALGRDGSLWKTKDSFTATHLDGMWVLVQYLEDKLGGIVVDRTQLPRGLDVNLKFDSTPEGLKKALLEQLGLELVVSEKPVPAVVLVLEKKVKPTLLTQNTIADFQADGTIHYQFKAQAVNTTHDAMLKDYAIGDDTPFDQISDELGHSLEFSVQRDGGPLLMIALNQPVPAGGKYELTFETILPHSAYLTKEPGVFEYRLQKMPDGLIRSQEAYRLPAGAVVISKQPSGFKEVVTEGRVELRLARTIENGDAKPIKLKYRLPVAGK